LIIENILASGSKKTAEKTAVKPTETKPEKAKAKKAESDDLRKVEGIGPKIAAIFQENGITTFEALSKTSVEKLAEILAAAGGTYASKNPSTWPQQATLAAAGEWDALKKLQDELNGGLQK
jgi:large subunit ribosomal protein L21